MDSQTAGLLGILFGGVIGVAGSMGSTWLAHHLETSDAKALDAIRKNRLRQMLSGKFTWRSLETLADAIGADEDTTAALLLEIEARRSMAQGKDSWGLISRAPFPDDVPPT